MSESPSSSSGLRVHRSNHVEVLAKVLAEMLRVDFAQLLDPIVPAQVVVGNRGTERWLAHQLADMHRISANFKFPFPASVIERIQVWALGDVERPAAWRSGSLLWVVLDTLRGLGDDATWAPLQRWMVAEPNDTPHIVDRRLFGLGVQVVSVLDRLCTFRPEWMAAWATGVVGPLPASVDPWIPALWHRVCVRLGPGNPAERWMQAMTCLQSSRATPPPFSSLHLFGLSTLPPPYVQLLGAASRHFAIDLYLLSPSNQFWSDVRRGCADLPSPLTMARDQLAAKLEQTLPPDEAPAPGRTRPNPMLATFGRVARDFQAVLERLPEGYRDATLEAELFIDPVADSAAAEGPSSTALKWLQSDILAMRHPADHKQQVADFERRRLRADDRSVQLHSCYGLARQIEALRDALLHLFAADETLLPRDVVVMCPRIAEVAPLVSAVFGAKRGRGAPPSIPYRMTDQSIQAVNPVATVVLRILSMATSRFDAPSVVDLFAYEPVRARFGLSAEDVPGIGRLVRASGARWGRDRDQRTEFDQPSDNFCTWRFGLERLSMGLLAGDLGPSPLPLGIRPEAAVLGNDRGLVAPLVEFVVALAAELARFQVPASPGAWADRLDRMLDRLVAPTTPAGFRIRQVRLHLDVLRSSTLAAEQDGSTLMMDAGAIRAWLEARFTEDAEGHGQQTGSVTFCSLLPERGVPNRVVCLLGMDDGSFPRVGSSTGFDPLMREPRVGDRDPRDEDRYLLLEALLAARDAFLVFWSGRDIRSNEELPPAVPIGEFVDVLEASFLPPDGWRTVRDVLLIHHALQPFGPRNFAAGALAPRGESGAAGAHWLAGQPWSYDGRLVAGARALRALPMEPRPFWPRSYAGLVEDDDKVIDVDDFLGFWKEPVAGLVQRELGVWLADWTDVLPDREPVELDALRDFAVKSEMVEGALGHVDASFVEEKLRGSGVLPIGTLGTLAYQDAKVPVDTALQKLGVLDLPLRSIRVDVQCPGEVHLEGAVAGVGQRTLQRVVVGSWEGRKILRSWLEAVLLTASGHPIPWICAWTGSGRKEAGVRSCLPFGGDSGAASRYLARLVEGYQRGRREPLLFFSRSSWAFLAASTGKGKPSVGEVLWDEPGNLAAIQVGTKAAAQHWWGSEALRGDLQDPSIEKLFGQSCPFLDDDGNASEAFRNWALTVFGPLFAGDSA